MFFVVWVWKIESTRNNVYKKNHLLSWKEPRHERLRLKTPLIERHIWKMSSFFYLQRFFFSSFHRDFIMHFTMQTFLFLFFITCLKLNEWDSPLISLHTQVGCRLKRVYKKPLSPGYVCAKKKTRQWNTNLSVTFNVEY